MYILLIIVVFIGLGIVSKLIIKKSINSSDPGNIFIFSQQKDPPIVIIPKKKLKKPTKKDSVRKDTNKKKVSKNVSKGPIKRKK